MDNELYIQEVVQIALETINNWRVVTASSGAEGLLKAEKERPDAILLDMMMPDMDGATTFQKLQANPVTQTIPVLLLTAKIQTADQKRYQAMGVHSTIAKPFDPLQLPTQIADVLGWQL
ncbi:response regulator receiver domain protein [Acaryochloris marina MBIC11017]|uniref:Response regulator receiver domain protein n=1 Tax=Acaryochloris marina (strain MBIC 11017) TaxID=329726 RepID=B0C173_ACAM1|nr:response regulator receiver domain protein [Acaryochloris marina MBIC11017]